MTAAPSGRALAEGFGAGAGYEIPALNTAATSQHGGDALVPTERRPTLGTPARLLQSLGGPLSRLDHSASTAPSPVVRGEGRRGDTSDQGVTVTVVVEALQLLVSSVSTTVFGPSAQASRK